MSGSSKLFIDGPAGRLQALWRSGGDSHERSECKPDAKRKRDSAQPQETAQRSRNNFERAAIICHPHPKFGGTMENKVVARSSRYISEAGIEAIRFNFRGVQQSDGSFDDGHGECDDLRAVIEYVRSIAPSSKLAVAGFSFGAWIALQVGPTHPAVSALVAIAPPLRLFDFDYPDSPSKPTLVVYAGNDQYTDATTTGEWLKKQKQPIESVLIPHVDHFFGDKVDEVGRKVAEFLERVL